MTADATAGVGVRDVPCHDPVQATAVPLALLYPTTAATAPTRFGPYPLDVARDADVAGDALPLVVVSHGNGGSPWAYRGLAAHLVGAGLAVAMVEHPGNSRRDNALAGTDDNLRNRPRHLGLAIDAALADPVLGPRLAPARVGVLGHSIGGYTALALAGGHAMSLPADVGGAGRAAPDAEAAARAYPLATARDPRVGAVALLAPALGWFLADGALADLDPGLAILVRTGARDPICPTLQIRAALRSVPAPARVDLVEVAGAGHFSFSTPFPPELTRPDFPPSQDPPGFDRAAYHATLRVELARFFTAALGVAA